MLAKHLEKKPGFVYEGQHYDPAELARLKALPNPPQKLIDATGYPFVGERQITCWFENTNRAAKNPNRVFLIDLPFKTFQSESPDKVHNLEKMIQQLRLGEPTMFLVPTHVANHLINHTTNTLVMPVSDGAAIVHNMAMVGTRTINPTNVTVSTPSYITVEDFQ